LQPVVGGGIFLMLERQEVGRECEFADRPRRAAYAALLSSIVAG